MWVNGYYKVVPFIDTDNKTLIIFHAVVPGIFVLYS